MHLNAWCLKGLSTLRVRLPGRGDLGHWKHVCLLRAHGAKGIFRMPLGASIWQC